MDFTDELTQLKKEKTALQAQLDDLYVNPSKPSLGYKAGVTNGDDKVHDLQQRLVKNQEAQTTLMPIQTERREEMRSVVQEAMSKDRSEWREEMRSIVKEAMAETERRDFERMAETERREIERMAETERHEIELLEMRSIVKATAEKQRTEFFDLTYGIGDVASVSEKSSIDKDEVRKKFSKKCLLTGEPYEAPGDTHHVKNQPPPTHKIAHIIPRKTRNNGAEMNRFKLRTSDLDDDKNLIFVKAEYEHALDHFKMAFCPNSDGTFSILTAPGFEMQGAKIVMPDHVSRRHLMIHAMDFHRHHFGSSRPFNFEDWRDITPRKSTNEMVEQWLKSTTTEATATAAESGAQ